ncbi:unnamed protein product [Somion occarium]|uniref:Uncharacterized protein n=1 Tax=Somion occarium TaxID=3059160 RepID=A0ABP1E6R5_9APHY
MPLSALALSSTHHVPRPSRFDKEIPGVNFKIKRYQMVAIGSAVGVFSLVSNAQQSSLFIWLKRSTATVAPSNTTHGHLKKVQKGDSAYIAFRLTAQYDLKVIELETNPDNSNEGSSPAESTPLTNSTLSSPVFFGSDTIRTYACLILSPPEIYYLVSSCLYQSERLSFALLSRREAPFRPSSQVSRLLPHRVMSEIRRTCGVLALSAYKVAAGNASS